MTLARVKQTGKGSIHARLVIEGLSVQFVSSQRMAGTFGDGRTRCVGLALGGVKIGARADLRRSTLEASSWEATIKDIGGRVAGSRHGTITRELWMRPTASTFLSTGAGPADTTLTVYDTTSFPAVGTVHIGTEAIRYLGKTATTFTGCTRGSWDSIAQRHFVADGEGLADARVTDRASGIEGRRAYLYLYGDGDAPLGAGSLRWRGVCATDLRWSAGVWTVSLDAITRLLDQHVGSSSSETMRVRGIYYGPAHPWVLRVTDPLTLASAQNIPLVGFFETSAAFCVAATAAITAAITASALALGAGGAVSVDPSPDGYSIVYRGRTVGSPPVLVFRLMPSEVSGSSAVSGQALDPSAYSELSPPTAGFAPLHVRAPFPRGALLGGVRGRAQYTDPIGGNPFGSFVHLSTYSVPAAGSYVAIASADDTEEIYQVIERDVGLRRITVRGDSTRRLDAFTEMSVGAALGYGNVVDLLTSIIANAADTANSGASPLLTAGDITWTADVTTALASEPLCSGRSWIAFDQSTLRDLIEPELMALGAYMRIGLDGALQIDMLRPALVTDTTALSIDDSQGSPTVERGAYGTLGLVRYHFAYDPREDEHRRVIAVRDVQNASATRAPIESDIKQRSTSGAVLLSTGEVLDGVPPLLENIIAIATRQFGFFGTDYSTISTSGDPRHMDLRVGDVVAYSSQLLPDVTTGTGATVGRGVRVVGQSLELASGRVELELLLHVERFAGYAFGAAVASAALVAGLQHDITLEAGYSEESATRHVYVGMPVVCYEQDNAAPATQNGVVDTVISASVVRVTFTSAAPSFIGLWALAVRQSSAIASTSTAASLTHVGGNDGIGYLDATVPAKVFA